MKRLFYFALPVLLVILLNTKVSSQTWDKKTAEHRQTQILYKLCNGGEINQQDYTDLYEKGLIDIIVKNANSDKSVEQVKKIIKGSKKFFDNKCKLYLASADSIYSSYRSKNSQDSVMVVPDK